MLLLLLFLSIAEALSCLTELTGWVNGISFCVGVCVRGCTDDWVIDEAFFRQLISLETQ